MDLAIYAQVITAAFPKGLSVHLFKQPNHPPPQLNMILSGREGIPAIIFMFHTCIFWCDYHQVHKYPQHAWIKVLGQLAKLDETEIDVCKYKQ